jgi:hypothetical protein
LTATQAIADYPEAKNGDETSYVDDETINKSLASLGFKMPDIRSALEALSSNAAFTTSLLSTLPPLDAALEYLLLHTAESDLPPHFNPSNVSSSGFVSSAHVGEESIQQRWMEDRAVKDAGYPRMATKEAFGHVMGSFSTVFEVLLRRLLGLPHLEFGLEAFDQGARDASREGELEAVQSVFPTATFDSGTSILSVPLVTAPATFNLIYAAHHPYPESTRLPPYYITSASLPPYVRLHLTAAIALAISPNGARFEGEGICFNAIEAAETAWGLIAENGPPKMEEVLCHLLPAPRALANKVATEPLKGQARPVARNHRGDTRSSDQIRREFENLRSQKAYKVIEEQRSHLPAWNIRDIIVQMIQGNQVIVVVGETGMVVHAS